MCGHKHFRFLQKYRMRPQASAEDRYPVLPSASSAADAFTDVLVCVCGRVHIVHIYGRVCKCTHVCAAMCWRVNASVCVPRRVHGNVLVCTSLLCCLCRFLLLFLVNGEREGERSWLSHGCLERQVGQFGSWNLTCVCAISVKQQLGKPTTEPVLLAYLHAELGLIYHFWEIGRLISSCV